MKHAIIFGHPNTQSFTASVANAYRDAVLKRGGEVVMRDLYALAFDPRLQGNEIPNPGFKAGDDVTAERAAIADADVFAFVYPLWFNAPPAIVVGYIQRVFGMGFGYASSLTGNRPLLTGKKMVSLTSSGAPTEWLQSEGGLDALRNLFDAHVAGVCGFEVVGRRHFGHVVPGARDTLIQGYLSQVADVVGEVLAAR